MIGYFCKVCEQWIRDFDIDAIRFDVGNEVSHRFLKQMRTHLKQIKPDIYLLGEIWHDASQWLMGDEYDSVMNYPLMSGIHDFFLDASMDKKSLSTWSTAVILCIRSRITMYCSTSSILMIRRG